MALTSSLSTDRTGTDAAGTGRLLETHDPRTGALLAVVRDHTADEVQAAVERARAAFPAWSALSVRDRVHHLRMVRDRIVDRAEQLVETICAETGKQPSEAVTTELMAVCETLTYYLGNAESMLRPEKVSAGMLAHKRPVKRFEPMGVVGVISPWNYPFTLSMTPLLTALIAGNTVVLKPSEITPTVGTAIAELFRGLDSADTWGDIVQVVTGAGATGEALVRSGVAKVAFTGSARTGRLVMKAAADTLTPVVLELGGKDPMIVCADADLVRAAKGAVWGAFQNSGQTCQSVERVYVEAPVYERFVDRVVAEAIAVRHGTPDGDIGSMTFEPQVGIVERHISDAVQRGAKVLTGGGRVTDRPGLWFEPTVLVDVTHDMAIMREESFGPVLPIMRVADTEEAVRLANDSDYGLSSSVWSADGDRAQRLAERIEAGNVCINDCIASYAVPGLPFGGVKHSGIGRVHGPEGLREFCHVKSVLGERVSMQRELWWFPIPKGLDRLGIRSLRLRYGSGWRRKLQALRP